MPAEVGVEPDPRLARTDLAVDFMNQAMPHFTLMHEMTTDHVHEEIQLLVNDFSSMLMETLGHVPAWRDHYLAHDQTPHYEHLRAPAPGAAAPARRAALAAQVAAAPRAAAGAREGVPRPDRRRHPPRPGAGDALDAGDARATPRGCTARPVDCDEIVDYWVDRLDLMLRSLVRDRDAIPAERSIDVRFDDFMADDLATAERVYELAGEPLTDEAARRDGGLPRRAPARPARHRRDQRRRCSGSTTTELRERFAPYVERFLADSLTTRTRSTKLTRVN